MSAFQILSGIPEQHQRRAAELHFEAFDGKIGGILGRDGRGKDFFADIIDPDFGICAVSADGGALLGIAGFKTVEGSLINGGFGDIKKHYGFIGGLWRGFVLALLERPVEDGRLLMDGIAVEPGERGKGIGSALLNGVFEEAANRRKAEIRLDVIDTNSRARALYERKGFVAGEIQRLGPLRHIFGFSSATTMIKRLN